MGYAATALCGGLGLGFFILIFISIAKQFLFVCRPYEVLIISGRGSTDSDNPQGNQPIFRGRVWRKPFLERVDRMDLRTIPVVIEVKNAYSKGGIPLNVHAVANVKITSDPRHIMNAVVRFLGRDSEEIRRVGKETLEGHLRGVLAQLTPEQVNEDKLVFAEKLVEEAEDDFLKMGLHLDTLKIQNVYDDVNYLDGIGRERIANVLRDAKMAEDNAKTEVERAEAQARQFCDVAMQTAETQISKSTNEFLKVKAELEVTAKSEEERTIQMVAQARSEAEVALQDLRQRLEQTRLQGEVILPADARGEAEALRAQGAAALIRETGNSQAAVLELMTAAWLKAGPDAKDIFLIQQLETVLRTVVDKVGAVRVGEVVLLDGGDGTALPAFVASYPAMVAKVLDEIRASTGVDIIGTLAGTSRSGSEV